MILLRSEQQFLKIAQADELQFVAAAHQLEARQREIKRQQQGIDREGQNDQHGRQDQKCRCLPVTPLREFGRDRKHVFYPLERDRYPRAI